MTDIKPPAIPAPREHHDLRRPDVEPGTAAGKRAAHARLDPTRPTRTMQRQLIARMVG